MSRRTAILGMATAATTAMSPTLPHAQSQSELHLQVAKRVRALADGRQLTLRLLLPSGASGNLDPVIAAFQAMTGVGITSHETPVEEINTELLLDALSQTQRFDLALPATYGLPDLVSADAIQPITTYAQKYEPDGFRDGILYRVGDTYDQKLYGFQTDGDAYIMFYHKGMLEDPIERAQYEDRFGAPLTRPDTWAELDQQMAFFNRPDEGKWGGLLFRSPGYLAWEWWMRFHAKGVWPFSPDMRPQIASDAGIEALEEMIRATENLHPSTSDLTVFANWKRYARGDVYCNIGWGGSQKHLNSPESQMRGKMLHGPTPGGMVNGQLLITPYFNWGWNYVVTSTTDRPELAYLFALFASSPKISTLAVRQIDGFFDPYRPEHYEDAGIKEAYTPEFLKVHRASLEQAIPDLYLNSQGEYFRVLTEWLGRAMRFETAPKIALERVAQRWDLITRSSGRAKQVERWQRLRAQYPPQIRNLLMDLPDAG